jgi:hypothetical protein
MLWTSGASTKQLLNPSSFGTVYEIRIDQAVIKQALFEIKKEIPA